MEEREEERIRRGERQVKKEKQDKNERECGTKVGGKSWKEQW